MAPALGGAADLAKAVSIDLEKLPEEFRLQRLLFVAARKAFETLQHGFTGGRESLIQQLIRLVEQFFNSDKLDIPSLFHQDPLRKRILIALSIDSIVQHVIEHVHQENAERLEPVFDPEFPIGSTRRCGRGTRRNPAWKRRSHRSATRWSTAPGSTTPRRYWRSAPMFRPTPRTTISASNSTTCGVVAGANTSPTS